MVSTFDRDAVIEQAQGAIRGALAMTAPIWEAITRRAAAAAVPAIVDATLAPIEALHKPWGNDPADGCRSGCSNYNSTGRLQRYPCATAKAITEIKAATR